MTKNKEQHVVPRAYIAQWTDPETPTEYDPYVWVYERGVAEPYRRAPKKLLVKSYYYSWFDRDGGRNDAADELLQALEDRGLPLLRRLDDNQQAEALTPEERYDFANFAALLTLRVPQFRDSVEKSQIDLARMTGQVAAAHPGYLERWAETHYAKDGRPTPSKEVIAKARAILLSRETQLRVDPLVSLQAMLQMRAVVARHICDSCWRILRAPDGARFIAGDCPLVKVTTEKRPAPYGVGWATPYMEATLPLSPRTCLLISLHHPPGDEVIDLERVSDINLRSAVYSRTLVYSAAPVDPRTLNRPSDWTWWRPASNVVDLTDLEDNDPAK